MGFVLSLLVSINYVLVNDMIRIWLERSHINFKLTIVVLQMELDSKDLMIDRLNSQNKQRALNTSINENDELSVSGKTVIRVVGVSRNVSHRCGVTPCITS